MAERKSRNATAAGGAASKSDTKKRGTGKTSGSGRSSSAKPGSAQQATGASRDERVRSRAYQIWEEEGRPAGRESQHWDQANREVKD